MTSGAVYHLGYRHAAGQDVIHARDSRVDQDLSGAAELPRHAKRKWPQLAAVDVRYRGQFAYVTSELSDGGQVPLMRLRYGGSAHRWGTAIYVASSDSYKSRVWFSGTTEEAFDFVRDILIGTITP